MKSGRNKTIDISLEDGREYLEKCIHVNSPMAFGDVENKIVIGDTFDVMSCLPRNFVDLLIVDPPYNMDKEFNGNKFSKKDESEYREYTAAWIEKALPLLKPDASDNKA
jgi:site-specific DNA-methyltransferase (adenine-specific)